MTKVIHETHSEQAVIEQLKALQRELDAEAEFEFHMKDLTSFKAVVVERPALIVGVDERGQEGLSGLVRVDTQSGESRLIKLDAIDHVTRLGSS
jgi:ATP-dependent Lon protease